MKNKNSRAKIPARRWLALLLLGLVGQFAWTIENMYFNVFIYNTITDDPSVIAATVAASAITATLTTLLIGAWSDRTGRRKPFLTAGYFLWGLSTLAFGFISVENMQALFPAGNAVFLAGTAAIVMDCVMTFCGSTANDAAFNAWVTDITNEENRGKVESILSALPLISMLVIFGLFDSMTQQGRWKEFFLIFGILVTAVGILSLLLVKDAPNLQKQDAKFFRHIVYGLSPRAVKGNPPLYLMLTAFAIYGIATQIFMPYLIIYIQNYLKLDSYAIVLGVTLIVASVISVTLGRRIDKVGKVRFLLPAAAAMFVGLILMYFARGMVFVIIAGTILMSGYMLVNAAIGASVRDYTPADKVGHYQGIRMIFAVMLPMIIGPFIGSAVIKGSGEFYEDLGVLKQVPTPAIFLAAAVVLLLMLIPVFLLKRREKQA